MLEKAESCILGFFVFSAEINMVGPILPDPRVLESMALILARRSCTASAESGIWTEHEDVRVLEHWPYQVLSEGERDLDSTPLPFEESTRFLEGSD